MRGFFTTEETRSIKTQVRRSSGCAACGLHKKCESPKMAPSGKGKKSILVIAEAPGRREDEEGIQLIGPAGRLLRRELSSLGIDLDRDCVKTNAANCRPPKNKMQSQYIAHCRPRVWKVIEETKPHLILLLGGSAVQSFLGHRWHKNLGGITKWRGWTIPDRDVGAWVCPMQHPSFLLRNTTSNAAKVIFRRDLKRALKLLDIPFPEFEDETKRVHISRDVEETVEFLQQVSEDEPTIAIDFETTGLNPQVKGHAIVTCAISRSPVEAFAFPTSPAIVPFLKQVLRSSRIKKIAANMKHEQKWSRVILKTRIRGWTKDTMVNAHIRQNRKGVTSLKFLAYVHFGIIDYASHITPFLQGVPEKGQRKASNNAFNRIHKVPLPELLIYNGMDAMLEHRLAVEEPTRKKVYKLFHDGVLALSDIEQNGIVVDSVYYEKQLKAIAKRMEKQRGRLDKMDEVKLWRKIYGSGFKVSNDKQLVRVLEKLGHKLSLTDKEKENSSETGSSVNEESLEALGIPLCKRIIKLRKLKRAQDKINEVLRETVDGKIHPSFNLHLPRSFRSSCDHPNFQNMDVRNEMIAKLVRSGIVPRPGNQIGEIDYKGAEVCMAVCNHHDPTMLADVSDPEKDMHRDLAMQIYILKKKQVVKDSRYCAKNKFVFPEFYGDYYIRCAESLWEAIPARKLKTSDGIPLREHLRDEGIKGYRDFEDHIQAVEDWFWNEKYPVAKAWKEKTWKDYLKRGYIDMLTGFRCRELLSKNEALNRPIQGPAFHWLLWSLIRLNRWMKKEKLRSLLIAQIHDSILPDFVPDERDYILKKARKIMCEDIRDYWPWIITPLQIEAEISPIDEPWYSKKEVKF